MNYNRVVFLDIDGVLNNEIFINAFWAICELPTSKEGGLPSSTKQLLET